MPLTRNRLGRPSVPSLLGQRHLHKSKSRHHIPDPGDGFLRSDGRPHWMRHVSAGDGCLAASRSSSQPWRFPSLVMAWRLTDGTILAQDLLWIWCWELAMSKTRCDLPGCDRSFGLIRYRHFTAQFCSRDCHTQYRARWVVTRSLLRSAAEPEDLPQAPLEILPVGRGLTDTDTRERR